MNESKTSIPKNSIKISKVYLTNATIFGGSYANLNWTVDNRVQLQRLDEATENSSNLLLDCNLSQIQKANVQLSILYLKVNGKKYRLDFNRKGTVAMSAGAQVSGAGSSGGALASVGDAITIAANTAADRGTKKSDLDWWIEALRKEGISVDNLTLGKTYLITFVTIGVVFALMALGVLLTSLLSN